MTTFFRQRPLRYSLAGLSFLGIVAAILSMMFQFWTGLLFTIAIFIVLALTWMMESRTYRETENYIQTLSYRLKKVGDEALLELPLGILLIDEEHHVEWANPYTLKLFSRESLIGEELFELSEQFQFVVKLKADATYIMSIDERAFEAQYKSEEKLIYLREVTEQVETQELYEGDRTALGVILVDNYDELAQGMDDQVRSQLNSLVTSHITKWGNKNGIYVKRVSSDRFMIVLSEAILQQVEEAKFSILDDIREATAELSTALTLSIGVGVGDVTLVERGALAQSGLDLVLGRGGDQVAIKDATGKVRFYGGKRIRLKSVRE